MPGRRELLKNSAALAAGFSAASISRALALPPASRAGSIEDVQHIVVLMQENRSFDHYFGTLRGVRGYNDRFPVLLPGGRPVWFQPRQKAPDELLLPFHLDTSRTGAQSVADLYHDWTTTHAAINGGLQNAWPAQKTDLTMGHYTQADIPFHFELAEAFTICDQYFCALPGPTHPNRMFLMTGTNDPTGAGGGPLIDNVDPVDDNVPAFTWTTYPERLQQAGISWQVYQQGLDANDPYNGNFGLNVLQNFKQYIDAPADSPLRQRGYSVRTLDQFAQDAKSGKLPQVSWLLPPAAFSEHPKYMPAYGATYIAQALDTLTADPEVWRRTVLLVMYDENDGYFDHAIPPQPPGPVLPGQSTVSIAGEIHNVINPNHRPVYPIDNLPYGLGPRVPMFAVSPWSKGGFVNSQVFDHTSVIRFIEARFGVAEPNISPWRRAVCGDLTGAFDFSRPRDMPAILPSTAGYRARADEEVKTLPAPAPPPPNTQGALMPQEPGIRPARALPYRLAADFTAAIGGAKLHLANTGGQGACFYLYAQGSAAFPWHYTVGAGDVLDVDVPSGSARLMLYGPNGFFRSFVPGGSGLGITAATENEVLKLAFGNNGLAAMAVTLADNAYGRGARKLTVPASGTILEKIDLAPSFGWYDVTISAGEEIRRLAGHAETGRPSFTDPAAKAPVLSWV